MFYIIMNFKLITQWINKKSDIWKRWRCTHTKRNKIFSFLISNIINLAHLIGSINVEQHHTGNRYHNVIYKIYVDCVLMSDIDILLLLGFYYILSYNLSLCFIIMNEDLLISSFIQETSSKYQYFLKVFMPPLSNSFNFPLTCWVIISHNLLWFILNMFSFQIHRLSIIHSDTELILDITILILDNIHSKHNALIFIFILISFY